MTTKLQLSNEIGEDWHQKFYDVIILYSHWSNVNLNVHMDCQGTSEHSTHWLGSSHAGLCISVEGDEVSLAFA